MSRSRVLLCAALLVPALVAGAAPPKPKELSGGPRKKLLPFEASETTLPNGLKLIVVPTGFPDIVSLQIPVKTGARNEVEPGKSGFAHFFEHMMFRGTREYPPEKYQAVLTAAGARSNAYTSDDYTNYHTTFSKPDLETILKVEADRFMHLEYAEEAFKTESRAVLGEYNKNSAQPVRKLFEVQRDHAYRIHTYKHTGMGFLKDIEDMPNQFAYSKLFFARWYRPENTTLIVAGDVTPAQVIPLVQKYWGGWQKGTPPIAIPQEPAPSGPVYAHVPWSSPTLPWVTVAFHGPAFSETEKDWAALDVLSDLTFGPTSDLYKRLVEQEQKVDQLFASGSSSVDPSLLTVMARVKKPEDLVLVRDAILAAWARVRSEAVPAARLADARGAGRYGFVRTLDNTEAIAATLARYVHHRRAYATLENLYQVYDALTPADLLAAAQRYVTDERLVVTTLSSDTLPAAVATAPTLASLAAGGGAAVTPRVVQVSTLPQLTFKLAFAAGSAHDPQGKEGLAALTAAMLSEAGSSSQTIAEIRKALFPIAGSVESQVDKELTTFTLSVHADNWESFAAVALPQLLEPGFRKEDFERLKDQQMNALLQDLRGNNEEELGKERLQTNVFAGTPYGHPALGTVAGLEAITLDDVKAFARSAYTRQALSLGLSGALTPAVRSRLERALGQLPDGPPLPRATVVGRRPQGIEVELIEKETRSTAISFGLPIAVTRAHPDFAALWLTRAWLGDHRATLAHLYQVIREQRGMNYGDYAYIEAFPRGMFQFFPDPNLPRQAQLFEVWIRPLRTHEDAQMALRLAIDVLQRLIADGLTQEAFDAIRSYLLKNVALATATQAQRLGYALDSEWYQIPEYTGYMRERLSALTLADVNRAIRAHLSASDLSVVIITKDAAALRERLLADTPSALVYDSAKPEALLAEDKRVGALRLGIRPEAVKITPVDEVFRQ